MTITCWGDSLTHIGGMVARLAELSGTAVHNAGVGGENALLIAARCNAMPMMLEVVGAFDAETLAVLPTTSHHSGAALHPLMQGSGVPGQDEPRGTLAGVPGRLALVHRDPTAEPLIPGPADDYGFRPDYPAQAAAIAQLGQPARPFRYDFATEHRGDTAVLWIGQNGPDDQTTLAMVEAFAHWTRGEWVLMGPVGPEHPGWTPLECRLQDRFGRRFINVRRHLIDEGLHHQGIAMTARDDADIRDGRVPSSLRTDGVHHTPATQAAIAEHLVWPRLQEFAPFTSQP